MKSTRKKGTERSGYGAAESAELPKPRPLFRMGSSGFESHDSRQPLMIDNHSTKYIVVRSSISTRYGVVVHPTQKLL